MLGGGGDDATRTPQVEALVPMWMSLKQMSFGRCGMDPPVGARLG